MAAASGDLPDTVVSCTASQTSTSSKTGGLRCQGRKALAHVGDTRRQPDPRVGRDRDHAVRPRISRARASGSWLPLMRIRGPPASSISI